MSLEGKRIGFIGAGAMAEALAGGIVASGVAAESISAADPDPKRRKHFSEAVGAAAVADNGEIVGGSDIVVLAVKPDTVGAVLEGISDVPDDERARPLWVSIAAGVPLARLEAGLGDGARIVRAMPNTPALVRAGATAFCGNRQATSGDREAAQALFRCVGTVWEAPGESFMDAVTGLSGSGPAYVFLFLEALGEAGVRMGLPRQAAYDLATQTVFGAAQLALKTGLKPAELKDQVTSPGGTTFAGLEQLEAGELRSAVHAAVAAATRRSRELGQA